MAGQCSSAVISRMIRSGVRRFASFMFPIKEAPDIFTGRGKPGAYHRVTTWQVDFPPGLALAAPGAASLAWASMRLILRGLAILGTGVLCQCGGGMSGHGNMGGPTVEEWKASIASEPTGDFFTAAATMCKRPASGATSAARAKAGTAPSWRSCGRTRRSSRTACTEAGPDGNRYGYDNNYENTRCYFTGADSHDPNSNQFLPTFMLTAMRW